MPTEKCKYKKGTQTWLSTEHIQQRTSLFFFFFKYLLQMKLLYRHKNIKGWFILLKTIHRHFPLLQQRLIPCNFSGSERIHGEYVRPPY